MLPLIEREVVEVQGWVHRDEILDIVALSQSVPGAIAVNSAIFIGLHTAGADRGHCGALGNHNPFHWNHLDHSTFFYTVSI